MDQSNCLKIIIGPTKSGKTTFCHVLSSSRLTITQSLFKFEITAEGCSSGQEIGNHSESQTKFATKIGKFCDFPGSVTLKEKKVT
jgi:adenylate kinase family enzyme